jgi:glycosyltransferase involved in cell wall biosynthesis
MDLQSVSLPSVSVIIPTYNRSSLLRETVLSFAVQSYPSERFEIVVADNNSSDDTRDVVQQLMHEIPNLSYLFEPRQGVHYARNRAGADCRGEILYFTDDDMVADAELLFELVQAFQLDPRVGCATGKVLPRFQLPPPPWVERCLINSLLSLTAKKKAEELMVTRDCIAYSCHQAIRREVFLATGGFNPENTGGVWMGDGETGLNLKMRDCGWLFAYTARSVIYHVIPPGRTTLRYLVGRLSNQANCDSCTEYRTHRDRRDIPARLLRRNTLGTARILVELLLKLAMGELSWHFVPARLVYLYQRNVYDLKLFFDAELRAAIEVDDWLEQIDASEVTL